MALLSPVLTSGLPVRTSSSFQILFEERGERWRGVAHLAPVDEQLQRPIGGSLIERHGDVGPGADRRL